MPSPAPNPHIIRWRTLILFWIAQFLLIYIALAAFFSSHDFSFSQFLQTLIDTDFLLFFGFWALIITIAQALFLLPIRRPTIGRAKGWSLRASLIAAAIAVGAMLTAIFYAVIELANVWREFWTGTVDALHVDDFIAHFLPLAISWLIISPILLIFCRPISREHTLSKLSRRLLTGTVVEAVLVIPLDIMVRRRTDCYCDTGSFWALSFLGSVGFFAAGPAVFLPVLTRRRADWYRTHCPSCGYSLAGLSPESNCPECGRSRLKPIPAASKQKDEDNPGARTAP